MTENRGPYHIDPERLEAIVNAYAEFEPNVETATVEAYLLYDWSEGQEHQDWLDTADPQEIAEWIAATVFDDFPEPEENV